MLVHDINFCDIVQRTLSTEVKISVQMSYLPDKKTRRVSNTEDYSEVTKPPKKLPKKWRLVTGKLRSQSIFVAAFNCSFKFRNYANEGEETESGAEGFQQALLPTFKDPKMWAVRCKPGFERFTVTCLMQKMLNLQNTAERLQIYSVIAPDHLKGYLYIEADRDTFVKEVTQALQLFHLKRCQLFLAFSRTS